MSTHIVTPATKTAIATLVNQHLGVLENADPNDPVVKLATTELNELLSRVHREPNKVKAAVKSVMERAVRRPSHAVQEVNRIWNKYLIDSEAAKEAIRVQMNTGHRPRGAPSNVRDHGTSLEITRAPTNQWGMYTASTGNLGHGQVYNPAHQPGHFGSTPALMGAQNPQPSHQYQPQFPQTQQPVASSSTNWGQYANSRP
ncbi:hypothetical protein C8R43DRAFT_1191812 [Mycena crocata]|nr:hypothetical protein C8R43DRAFT_1191812 [Mycena crocata]